jgi:hypothetical protein
MLTPNTANTSEREFYVADGSSPVTPRTVEDAHPAAATAAVALAQLQNQRLSDWDSEMVGSSCQEQRRRADQDLLGEANPDRWNAD